MVVRINKVVKINLVRTISTTTTNLGYYLARLLVGVRHKATDKVRLAVVQGAHQLGEGDLRCKVDIDAQHKSSTSHQVDGGDGFAAAALLLLLALLLGGGGRLARVVCEDIEG